MNYNFNWTVIEKNIVPMLEGLGFGLLMAIIAITVGTIIGLLLALGIYILFSPLGIAA